MPAHVVLQQEGTKETLTEVIKKQPEKEFIKKSVNFCSSLQKFHCEKVAKQATLCMEYVWSIEFL